MRITKPPIEIIELSRTERRKLQAALESLVYPTSTRNSFFGDAYLEQFVAESFQAVVSSLSMKNLRHLLTMKSASDPPAVLIIKNCPADLVLPPTPSDGKRDNYNKSTSVGEAFLTGISAILGEPIGHIEEKNGCLLHDVVPAKQPKSQLSNEGSEPFGLHSENASFWVREKYVCFLGVRADHERKAETPVADIREALQRLPEPIIECLYKKEFVIRKPYILDASQVRPYSEPVALLTGPRHAPEVRASFYAEGTKGLTEEAENAKQAFAKALEAVAVPLKIEENTLVILHNFLCVHGRTAFVPRFDGFDRHLLRSYVLADLWAVRELQTRATRIIERAKAG
jgi:L-asparagine oxygenase